MKITIIEDEQQVEMEVIIRCQKSDEQVAELVSAISKHDMKLTGEKDGETYLLTEASIYYFESVDKKTFAYTQSDVYVVPYRLYELEERLGRDFFRAAKATIINLSKVNSIIPDYGGRLQLTLLTGEKLLVSRQYAQVLKNKFEI
ncbi:MAG: LytTR family transcriptional regulator [Oscillospiraceae bacterium]|nr:LytTR family transcriptional regulator [Oscillospiraceae bacterium]